MIIAYTSTVRPGSDIIHKHHWYPIPVPQIQVFRQPVPAIRSTAFLATPPLISLLIGSTCASFVASSVLNFILLLSYYVKTTHIYYLKSPGIA